MHWWFIDNQPTQGLYYATALFHTIIQARQTWLPLHNILTSETEYTGRTLYHEGCGDISVSMWSVFQWSFDISTQLDMEHGCVQHKRLS